MVKKTSTHKSHNPHPKGDAGKGGRRKDFAAENEIEDMRLFDGERGKKPSKPDGSPPAQLDDEFDLEPHAA